MNIKSLLAFPFLYATLMAALGAWRARSTYVEEYVRPHVGLRVLDIGCGPGDILEHLPEIDYLGFDMNPKYVNSATRMFGGRGRFICSRVGEMAVSEAGSFDLALATGVLHHLGDDEALKLFRLAQEALKPGGRLVTFDGCFEHGQSKIAQYLLSKDRGQFVRTKDEYVRLASKVFGDVKVSIRHDLLRIPYTHIILECTK